VQADRNKSKIKNCSFIEFLNDELFINLMGINTEYIKAKEKVAKLFKNKHGKPNENARLPLGQTLTSRFPVLDLGIQPDFNPRTYKLRVYGLAEEKTFTYNDILKMKATEFTEDLHCVTHWSKFDVKWKGILWKDFVKIVKPKENWKFIIQYGLDGYTTNVSREDLEKGNVLIAYELEGKQIPKEHGWPLRLIIPHLYAWKGSKFLTAIKFIEKDEPGFWEVRGYHNRGNAFLEERYG